MSEKLPCEITEIGLDSIVFNEGNEPINPTYINFFFGNNGVGKTTIARTIKKGIGLSYASGKTKEDYIPLVFDQDYINDNMQHYHDMPGVFTINEINIDIQKQIDAKTEEQNTAKRLIAEANDEISKQTKEKGKIDSKFHSACWDKTVKVRTEFEQTQKGLKNNKKKFAESLCLYSPVEHDVEKLKRTYDSVYSSDAKAYQPFNTVADINTLDTIEGHELLKLAIVNTANTPFAQYMKDIGSMEWVQKGHDSYQEKAGERCPYCGQTLPSEFEKMFAASFDKQYQINIQKISVFLNTYTEAAQALLSQLKQIPNEIYPAIDVKPYREKLSILQAIITENINKIKEKLAEPSRIFELDATSSTLKEITDTVKAFNELITANNDIVKEGDQKKEDCKTAIFEYLAFLVQDLSKTHNKQSTANSKEISKQQGIINKQKKLVEKLQGELRSLSSQTVETESAMNNINILLRESGFRGFELRPKREEVVSPDGTIETRIPARVRSYEVIRTATGEVADKLSEGEKNFIAFLYFQQCVFGSSSEDGDLREKIVVIDDPVSSMDSSTLYMVSAQVRKMIEICRNNADNRNPMVNGNFIKQIFILTHNAYFHREITYAYVKKYDFVSFYLIRKTGEKSSVKLCECQNPNSPSDLMNVNPVKNSYAALWDEYKEVSSGTPLMNVSRRILEYYFLQLCGYEGTNLRERILIQNKDAFVMKDELGNEDFTKFDLASSMLSYMSANTSVIDGLNYVDDCVDAQKCRDAFQMIFRCMEQEQHYNMMMGLN